MLKERDCHRFQTKLQAKFGDDSSTNELKICHVFGNLLVINTCKKALFLKIPLHKKWSFSLNIYSVNVTKSFDSCGFGHIYWRNI